MMKAETKKAAKETTPETKKVITNIDGLFKVKPQVQTYDVLHFTDLKQIKDVILFIGDNPSINTDLSLKYKKHTIKSGNYLIRLESGQFLKVVDNLDGYNKLTKQ